MIIQSNLFIFHFSQVPFLGNLLFANIEDLLRKDYLLTSIMAKRTS